jgi:hypothetical protein
LRADNGEENLTLIDTLIQYGSKITAGWDVVHVTENIALPKTIF